MQRPSPPIWRLRPRGADAAAIWKVRIEGAAQLPESDNPPTPGMPEVPSWTTGPRLVLVPDGSSDVVALRHGGYRQFELKTRCDHGTKSGAATAEIAADLERVARSDEFTLVGVFDGEIYRSFSGGKTETRGRKASLPELTAIFPPADKLARGSLHRCRFVFDETNYAALLVRQEVAGNGVRVIAVVDRE